MLGSSYVNHLKDYIKATHKKYRRSPIAPLPVKFIGVSGLRLSNLERLMRRSLSPSSRGVLVIQAGGNDVGHIRPSQWIDALELALCFVVAYCPNLWIFWSDMLPRRKRAIEGTNQLCPTFTRLRRKGRLITGRVTGRHTNYAILHKNISCDDLLDDGVHLSNEGNRKLISNIYESIWHLFNTI